METDKESVIRRASSQDSPASIATLLRDPYVLEFAGRAERPSYSEADLESALLDHLQTFLLELGTGFCFEARQKRITIGNEHDYIDLVFYHRFLRRHVLLDLKIRPFSHGEAGQMNFYLNYFKQEMMATDDKSTRRRHPLQRQKSDEGSVRDRRSGQSALRLALPGSAPVGRRASKIHRKRPRSNREQHARAGGPRTKQTPS